MVPFDFFIKILYQEIMNVDDIIDPYVVSDMLRTFLPKGRKRSPKGWESFNCVMCQQNGEPTRDKQDSGETSVFSRIIKLAR